MAKKMTFGRYDYAAFLAFICYAACSMIVPMCLVQIAGDLNFPLDQGGMGKGGLLQLGRSIPITVLLLFCGFIAGRWGHRISLGLSLLLMAAGILSAALAPAYIFLLLGLAITGMGEGIMEGLATPFCGELHPDNPGRYINFSHSFWSVGVVLTVLLCGWGLRSQLSWRLLPLAAGGLTLITAALMLWPNRRNRLVKHQPVAWKTTVRHARELCGRPNFWLFFAAMFFCGGAEFCLTFWTASYMQLRFQVTPMLAGFGIATFAAGMVLSRMGSGYFSHHSRMFKMLSGFIAFSLLISIGFPFVTSLPVLMVMLFLSGIGIGPFWPSVQSYGADRITGNNDMIYILLSVAGIPGCGVFSALMGFLGDRIGLQSAFFLVPACFIIIFALLASEQLLAGRSKTDVAG